MLESGPAIGYPREAHAVPRLAAAVGGAAGVEDLEAVVLLVKRDVRMAEDHGVALGELHPHPPQAPVRLARVVDEPDPRAGCLHDLALGKRPAEVRRVDVAVDGGKRRAQRSQLLQDFGGLMGEIRDGITRDSSIVQRPFDYALQPLPWHKGRVVLIGDAVHATTAHLASGAGIAVEDALVLTQELARANGDIEGALAAFEDRRYERCKFVVESSVGICRAQLAHAPAPEIGQLMGRAMHKLAEKI